MNVVRLDLKGEAGLHRMSTNYKVKRLKCKGRTNQLPIQLQAIGTKM